MWSLIVQQALKIWSNRAGQRSLPYLREPNCLLWQQRRPALPCWPPWLPGMGHWLPLLRLAGTGNAVWLHPSLQVHQRISGSQADVSLSAEVVLLNWKELIKEIGEQTSRWATWKTVCSVQAEPIWSQILRDSEMQNRAKSQLKLLFWLIAAPSSPDPTISPPRHMHALAYVCVRAKEGTLCCLPLLANIAKCPAYQIRLTHDIALGSK